MVLRRIAQLVVGAVFLLGAATKLYAPSSTEPSLAFLGFGGTGLVVAAAALVGTETFLGYSLAAKGGRWLTIASLGVLAVFTLVLGVFFFAKNPPTCGCLGLVQLFESSRTEAIFGIGRNCFLIGILLPSLSADAQRKSLA